MGGGGRQAGPGIPWVVSWEGSLATAHSGKLRHSTADRITPGSQIAPAGPGHGQAVQDIIAHLTMVLSAPVSHGAAADPRPTLWLRPQRDKRGRNTIGIRK